MKRDTFFFTFILLFFVVGLVACSNSPSKEDASVDKENTYVIKVGHAAAIDHLAQKSFVKFKEIVEIKSDGKIKVEIYPNGELGGKEKCLKSFSLVI